MQTPSQPLTTDEAQRKVTATNAAPWPQETAPFLVIDAKGDVIVPGSTVTDFRGAQLVFRSVSRGPVEGGEGKSCKVKVGEANGAYSAQLNADVFELTIHERLTDGSVVSASGARRTVRSAPLDTPSFFPEKVKTFKQTTEEFIAYLEGTLIPDLKEHGAPLTGADFEKCITIIRFLQKDAETMRAVRKLAKGG